MDVCLFDGAIVNLDFQLLNQPLKINRLFLGSVMTMVFISDFLIESRKPY